MASISEILLAQGRSRGDAIRQRADAWRPLIGELANLPAQIHEDKRLELARQQQQQQFAQQQAEAAQRQQIGGQQIALNQQRLDEGTASAGAAKSAAERAARVRDVFSTEGVLSPDGSPNFEKALEIAQQKGYDPLDIVNAANEVLTEHAKALKAKKDALPEAPKPPEPFTLNPGQTRFGSDGQQIANLPAEEKPDNRALNTQLADALKKGDKAGANLIRQAIREAAVAGHVESSGSSSGNGMSDVKEAVAAMKDGSVPPQMPGRASKDYTAIMAEAHRQGFDLATAATDWAATQKHIASMNSTQQLRLNQNINTLPETLDKVDELAAKWKGGRFPILNSLNLKAAKNGVYGSDVASVANQLETQIADVTADLGSVYMGGNSPTDQALKLAETALRGQWDEKVLHDMTKLARSNVQIRKNSVRNTGVAGASENNPYFQQSGGGNATAPKADPLGIR